MTITAVLYDPQTGRIRQSIQTSQQALDDLGLPYVEVGEWKPDYDLTHTVKDGKVIEK